MKRQLIYLFKIAGFLSSMVFLISSCEDDFLEKPAGADITIDTVFATPSNAQQLIFSLYHDDYFGADNIALSWWDAPQWYSSWSEIGEELYIGEGAGQGTSRFYGRGTFNTSASHMYPLDYLFLAVRKANTFIEKAPGIVTNSSEDDEYVRRMIGEAHAHLVYQYFKGIRVWGSLPWINKPLEGGEEPIPRASFNDIIDSMVVRLDMAAEMLPAQWEDRWNGRFTSVAAKALKAKVLVYAASPLYNGAPPAYASGYEHPEVLGYGSYDQQRWKRAADACKEAIDAAHAAGHTLYTGSGEQKNLYDLALNLTNEHIIYQRFMPANSEGGWRYVNNMMNWPYGIGWYNRVEIMYQPTIQHVDRYQMKNGKFPISGYTNGDPTQPIITEAGQQAGYNDQDYWKDRDPRFYQNIVYHGSPFGESYNDNPINFDIDPSVPNRTHGDWSGFKTSFITRKFVNEELGAGPSVTYRPVHPIIRLGDLYLLYAEALSEYNNGPNAEALQYFNEIRARSGMPDYDPANYPGGSAREQFHEAIRYEREVELYMEGQRYFDLRRWKEADRLNVKMGGVSINKGVVSRVDINWTNIFIDKMYFHPFHNDWVNNTPGLYQNPGW
jgi:hypothetical protein